MGSMRVIFRDEDVERVANEFVSRGELECGDTRRFDHAACGDTRGRGYVSCKPHEGGVGNVDLFYCHNCGESGARLRPCGSIRTLAVMKTVDDSSGDAIILPEDSTIMSSGDVPPHIYNWAEHYHVHDCARWSPSMGRIIMPVWEPLVGSLTGYQARRDPAGSTRIPKYLTVCAREKSLRLLVTPHSYSLSFPNTVVIVEDWVSAHQFRDFSGVWGAGLLGLNATAEYVLWVDTQLKLHTGSPPRYVIWLDNDVKKSFETRDYLARLLSTLGRTVHIQDTLDDPKKHSQQVLADTLRFMTSATYTAGTP